MELDSSISYNIGEITLRTVGGTKRILILWEDINPSISESSKQNKFPKIFLFFTFILFSFESSFLVVYFTLFSSLYE